MFGQRFGNTIWMISNHKTHRKNKNNVCIIVFSDSLVAGQAPVYKRTVSNPTMGWTILWYLDHKLIKWGKRPLPRPSERQGQKRQNALRTSAVGHAMLSTISVIASGMRAQILLAFACPRELLGCQYEGRLLGCRTLTKHIFEFMRGKCLVARAKFW